MIGLRSVRVEGFQSYREPVTWTLPDNGQPVLIYGENGNGKTGLVTALRWALTGRMPRGLNVGHLLHEDVDRGSVTVTFAHSNGTQAQQMCTVERIRLKSSTQLALTLDGRPVEVHGVADGNAWITERVGDVDHCFFGIAFPMFSRIDPAERLAMLSRIARAHRFRDARGDARVLADACQREVALACAERAPVLAQQKDEISACEQLEARLAVVQTAYEEQRAEIEIALDSEQQKASVEQRNVDALQGELTALENSGTAVEKAIHTINLQLERHKADAANVHTQLRHYETLINTNQCPTCEQSLLPVHGRFADHAQIARSQLSACEKKQTELGTERDRLQRELATLTTQAVDRDGQIQSARHRLANSERMVAELQAKLAALAKTPGVDEIQREIATRTEAITVLGEQIANFTVREELARQRAQAAQFWIGGYQQIHHLRLDAVAAALNTVASACAQSIGLAEGSIAVEVFREKASGKNEVEPKVNLQVLRPSGYRRPIETLSEGQRARSDLACYFALVSLLEASNDLTRGFLVLDEPLKALDESGKARMFDWIHHASAQHQLIVIDHDAHYRGRFGHTVRVERSNGTSRLCYDV